MDRRKFLSFLMVAPAVAPAALKECADMPMKVGSISIRGYTAEIPKILKESISIEVRGLDSYIKMLQQIGTLYRPILQQRSIIEQMREHDIFNEDDL